MLYGWRMQARPDGDAAASPRRIRFPELEDAPDHVMYGRTLNPPWARTLQLSIVAATSGKEYSDRR